MKTNPYTKPYETERNREISSLLIVPSKRDEQGNVVDNYETERNREISSLLIIPSKRDERDERDKKSSITPEKNGSIDTQKVKYFYLNK